MSVPQPSNTSMPYIPYPNPAPYPPDPGATTMSVNNMGPPPGKSHEQSTEEPAPTAPSVDQLEKVAGYENVTFNAAPLPPPTYDEALRGQPPERNEIGNMPSMNEEQVREALIHFVSEKCCYGKNPAKDMVIREIRYSSAFHYTLETYGEKRETAWDFEPYRGETLDTHANGHPPDPWTIQVNSPELFKNLVGKTQVPHTESVKPCHVCIGLGRKRCWSCSGMGQRTCTSCSGSGTTTVSHHDNNHHHHHHHHQRTCTFCGGSGHSRCFRCSGTGQVTCDTCSGHGQLKFFVKMTIDWTNHVEDFISDTANLPKELITEVSGQLAFEEQQPKVWPITHFPDSSVNTASQRIVTKHTSAFPMEKILQQRHRVRIVPVSEVQYTWKDQQGHFYVYGYENKVYFPDYPQKCCCGCTIL